MVNTSDVEIYFVEGKKTGIKMGAPVFFSHKSGSVIHELSQYLRERFVDSGRSSALTTWRSTAYKLAAWWDYLSARDLQWDQAQRQDLLKFRDFFLYKKSKVTGACYASGTVGAYVSVVIDFYHYYNRKGLYSESIVDDDKYQIKGKGKKLPYLSCDLIPRRNDEIIVHPYSPRDYLLFSKTLQKKVSQRDNLIFKLILMSGLRVSEVTSLLISQFLSNENDYPYTYRKIWVLGKGKKRRCIMIPNLLVEEISNYIFKEREIAVKKSGLKDAGALFVTEIKSKRPGRKLSARRIQEIHAQTNLQAGLIRKNKNHDERYDGNFFPKYRVHDLRHTYAVWSYHILKSMGDPEPWKFIQMQLGHKHLDTTINIYLKHVSLLDERVPMANLKEVMGW